MNINELKQITAMLTTAYPKFELSSKEAIKLWYMMLQDIDFEIMKSAVIKHIAESEFPPTIASLRKMATEISNPQIKAITGADAWGEVVKAIRNYGYSAEEKALASMSDITRKIVKRFGFKTLCMSENTIADRAHFIKAYEAEKKNSFDKALCHPVVSMKIAENKQKMLENTKNLASQLSIEGVIN